ncbi:hypothetical protein CCACVL1_28973 [Corchorus capsularis]|uniref:Uncharacterized protein n=1 Tax=Corchorus capsularis TaxID=210143 RepID=A0A1R3G4E2_COCAP|nr:hypothetical protein CCACVL1_28973 [Corchorus capsularis]
MGVSIGLGRSIRVGSTLRPRKSSDYFWDRRLTRGDFEPTRSIPQILGRPLDSSGKACCPFDLAFAKFVGNYKCGRSSMFEGVGIFISWEIIQLLVSGVPISDQSTRNIWEVRRAIGLSGWYRSKPNDHESQLRFFVFQMLDQNPMKGQT